MIIFKKLNEFLEGAEGVPEELDWSKT